MGLGLGPGPVDAALPLLVTLTLGRRQGLGQGWAQGPGLDLG